MTTPIQAAIEALTEVVASNGLMTPAQCKRTADVLAAIQAAQPVQSIDTADERAAFEVAFRPATPDGQYWMRRTIGGRYKNASTQSAWQGWQARAHIAQRAASGDVPVAVLVTPQEAAAAGIECGDTECDGCNSGEPWCIHAAPAPIADEVAGGWMPSKLVEFMDAHRKAIVANNDAATDKVVGQIIAYLTCEYPMPFARRPPAPKASAPDAPAGDLPPPSDLRIETYSPVARPQWMAHNNRGIRITHIPSGISAECHEDRNQHRNRAWAFEELCKKLEAARAAAAPAGHAEPVADCRMEGGICSCHSGGSYGGCRKERESCCAAPVAVEPTITGWEMCSKCNGEGFHEKRSEPEFVLDLGSAAERQTLTREDARKFRDHVIAARAAPVAVEPAAKKAVHIGDSLIERQLIVGKFYMVVITYCPDVDNDWELRGMPARFAGYDDKGLKLWNFLDPDPREWPVTVLKMID